MSENMSADPAAARLAELWATIPPHIRAAVMALVDISTRKAA
jgi:hypothetical protein